MRQGSRKKRNPKCQPEAEFGMRRGGHSEAEVRGETLSLTNKRSQCKKNYTLLTSFAWPQQ